jgi:hypothetical protein
MKQVLVLAHAADAGAAAVAAQLQRTLGDDVVRVVRPEALGVARWSHRVDARGRASTRVRIPAMPVLESAAIGAVLNRIRFIPLPRFCCSTRKDQDYAGAEMQALVASWLAQYGELAIHDVRRHPWVTPTVQAQAWATAAAACGLPVAPTRVATSARLQRSVAPGVPTRDGDAAADTSCQPLDDNEHSGTDDVFDETVLVAGDEAEGTLAGRFGRPCLAAARRLGYALLEFRFVRTAGCMTLSGVDALPALDRPGAVEATCRLVMSRLALQ